MWPEQENLLPWCFTGAHYFSWLGHMVRKCFCICNIYSVHLLLVTWLCRSFHHQKSTHHIQIPSLMLDLMECFWYQNTLWLYLWLHLANFKKCWFFEIFGYSSESDVGDVIKEVLVISTAEVSKWRSLLNFHSAHFHKLCRRITVVQP
jgi:hypothetical protein